MIFLGLSGKIEKIESSRQKKCQMESFAEERMKKYISVFLLVLADSRFVLDVAEARRYRRLDSPAAAELRVVRYL